MVTDPETPGHEDELQRETAALFEEFAADLVEGSPFGQLGIHIFIYPAPSLKQLARMVEDKVREVV
ncbi:hypothetical protein D3C81_2096710 [compost metagenome]